LRAFVVLAGTRHFGAAAQALGLTQPALSQSIKALEAGLGVTLLDRRPRRLALTGAGEMFLPEAQAAVAQADRAEAAARRAARGQAGLVELGYTGSVPFSPVFTRLIARLRAEAPDITLRMTQLPAAVQLERIAGLALDAGFVRSPVGTVPPGLVCRELAQERLLLALPAGHHLAGSAPLAFGACAGEGFIQYLPQPQGGLHGLVAGLAQEAGFVPRVTQIVPQVATMLCLVQAGLGVALVPESVSALGLPGISFRPLAAPTAQTALCLIFRHPEPAAPVATVCRLALRR
jgi:DNA-binding transcriptional LysR family regulator